VLRLNLTSMKKMYIITIGLMTGFLVFITCKPDPVDPPPQPIPAPNRPPIAIAGKDSSITLLSCGASGSIMLDARASSDPENSPLTYLWRVIFAPNNRYNISNNRITQPIISNMTGGEYDIELTVADLSGLTARDTVVVYIIPSISVAYDLDITLTGSFHFEDNYADCYYCYPCCYYDLCYVDYGGGDFAPIGHFNFSGYEDSDTSSTSNSHNTYFSLYNSNNNMSVYGTSSVNLKKVFQSGGGSFNGTFTPTAGSALNCDPNIYKSLAPLVVTGTLNATTKAVAINIKGKIFF